ncbi:hypothetical protein PCL_11995 [Purpureocillium lilacinum]|uniref:Uncharacterized protein n=1 Tax=Purpureocillium lilacinum TaxID=33203 RepID=A0A2U3EBK8_PURLI|nr:hypothetical protein Purlil1_12041 [Purpureocillium lilacinum]PWI71901.1 hypothetical protein PCL_11995 [Purpureocillium lilacinum]
MPQPWQTPKETMEGFLDFAWRVAASSRLTSGTAALAHAEGARALSSDRLDQQFECRQRKATGEEHPAGIASYRAPLPT